METGQAIAIVDIGEASTEASISLCDDAQLKVLVKDSEKIGGADFDRAVIEHIIQQLAISNPDDALRSQVRLAWLKAKFEWEDEKATNIEVGNHKTVHLDRATFKALNTNNLTKVKHFVRHIASSKITEEKDRVDTVALLGGSSQIPEIVSIVEDAFDRKILNKYVLLSFPWTLLIRTICSSKGFAIGESVAFGATIQAKNLFDNDEDVPVLLDIASRSIGMQTFGGVMTPFITNDTPIPTTDILKRYVLNMFRSAIIFF